MIKDNRIAALCGLIVLCVLGALYLGAEAPVTLQRTAPKSTKAAAALRCMPVYSNLEPASEAESFEIDTAHGSEGYFAVTAKSGSKIKLRVISGSGSEIVYNVPNTGHTAFYPFSDGSGLYSIQLMRKATDDPKDSSYERVAEKSFGVALFDEFQPFLHPSTYVWFTGNSNCVSEAAGLCAGLSDDDEKIARIKRFVLERLIYDETFSDGEEQGFIRDPDAILSAGKGVCLDYAVLTAAMLRSQGIPAKVVYGRLSGAESSHAWNMVYSSSRGWFRLDLSSADSGILDSFVSDDENYTDRGWYYTVIRQNCTGKAPVNGLY